jgi:D-sedoheptulose 7-phosphate isomerase
MSETMHGQVEAYFKTLGGLGSCTLVTDRAGNAVALEVAMGWCMNTLGRVQRDRQRVFFIGNGGSAGIASHMATDWMKNGGFAATAFNDGAMLTCLANDLGYDQVFALPLARQARAGDLLIAISSSGKSSNILAGVKAARTADAQVVTLSGFGVDNPLRASGDMNFYVPNNLYGFVEIAHLTICHALLDLAMGWRADGREPIYAMSSASGIP